MTPEAEFTAEQAELARLMSEISEECYCAGWMMGLEDALWAALQDGDLRYGRGRIDATKLERCRALSEWIGGWIVWVDDEQDPSLPVEQWGPQFVTFEEWPR